MRCGDRIPEGARFSAPVQTGHGTHLASYTMGTGSIPGVKRPRRGAEVKERVLPIWDFVGCSKVNFTITLTERPLGRHWRASETNDERHLEGCELHPNDSG